MAVNDQQFCLRWNNHQSTLISVFDSLLENGTLVDCTIAAEGQYLKAHKVVLSACSPYLEVLLSQHYEKHPIVILKDVKFSELKSMMDYMYKGEVNISQDQLGTFLKAAESLQIKGLSDNGDEGAVGSSAPKKDPPARPSVTQTRAPAESKRPAPSGDVSDASRDGSISPSSIRKRRRTRRPSQGDDPDNHFDSSNVCDPAAQSTPMPVPNVTVPTPVIPKQIVKQEPNLSINDTGLKKEIIDPPTEPLLEPKTEYLDYMNNENSIEVEDLTLDDDDDLDSSMDASRPGPSHGDMSNQGYQWPMTGDQSGTDEIFMAAQEAVGAATAQQQRDSQGLKFKTPSSSLRAAKLKGIDQRHKIEKQFKRRRTSGGKVNGTALTIVKRPLKPVDSRNWNGPPAKITRTVKRSPDGTPTILGRDGRTLGSYFLKKRINCEKCNELVLEKSVRIHNKYYCGVQPDEREWKLCGGMALCKKCGLMQTLDAIEFHVGYLCHVKPITVQCFYCTRMFSHYKSLLQHTYQAHRKKHKYLDLISILPKADPATSQRPDKVVKNFFSSLSPLEESFVDDQTNEVLQVRQTSAHKCEKCGKELIGMRAFENHKNTQCDSTDQNYSCFFCAFKAEYAYQVLDHMEEGHGKYFNTFDLLQAKFTGIVPVVKTQEEEVDFADQNLYEPFVSPTLFPAVKKEPRHVAKKIKTEIASANFEPPPSCSTAEDTEVIVQIGESVKMRNNRKPINPEVAPKKVKLKRPTLKIFRKVKHPKLTLTHKKKTLQKVCSLCNQAFHPASFRIHKKYHCGKDDSESLWDLKPNGRAMCLKCNTLKNASNIDFHVIYKCNQKPFSVQCFYCPKITVSYQSLLGHMARGHNKAHYYEDLMSILPPPQSPQDNPTGAFSSKLVFHPFIYEPPIKNEHDDPTMFKFPNGHDIYACFYCEVKNDAAFLILDHMEDAHEKKHNLYDLLRAKLVAETANSETPEN